MSATLLVLPALSLTRRVAAVPHQRVVAEARNATVRDSPLGMGCGNRRKWDRICVAPRGTVFNTPFA